MTLLQTIPAGTSAAIAAPDYRRVSEISAWLIKMPLVVPYRLAFGVQDSFDCVIVRVTDETAREGWGEAALLPGYTDESAQSSWQTAKSVAPRLVGLDGAEALAEAERLLADAAFTACSFLTAMDHAAGHPALSVMGRQPLLGTVNGKPDDRAALTSEIEALIAAGYTTLKMKVGFDLSADLKAVAIIRDIVAGRALLRIDGNQGYAREDAVAFLSQLSPEGVELIEQPCAAHDWDAAVAVKQAASVPVMMDESIYGEDDIRRAADLQCADYIKLKLMKMGSLDRLARGLELVRSLGMRTVMGNGVASDLGCWMEACIGVAHLDNAGEMNGFLKPRQTLLKTPLRMEGPCVALDGSAMEVDEGKLSQLKTDHAAWGSRP